MVVWLHYTVENEASRNIAEALSGLPLPPSVEWREWDCHVLEIEPQEGYNVILSPHRAKSGIPALTAHTPGNWSQALYGGRPFQLSVAWPSFLYLVMKALHQLVPQERGLDVVYEVDHHGPSSPFPTAFVELGSNEEQWRDRGNAALLAEALSQALWAWHRGERAGRVLVGVGGGHYARKFTRKSVEEGWAFAHIMPKHEVDSVGERLEEMLQQAVERSVERPTAVAVERKGLRGEQRERVRKALESIGLEWFYI